MTEIQRSVLVAIAAGVVISLITSVLVLAQPIYMLQIMMNVLPSRNVYTLVSISIVVGLAFVTSAVLEFFRSRILESAALRLEARVNHKIINDYLYESADDEVNLEALKDVTLLRTLATSRIAASLFQLISVPFILAVIFFVSVPLGLVFVSGIFVYLGIVIIQELVSRQSRPVLAGISGEANTLLGKEVNRAALSVGSVLHGAFARRYMDANRRYMEAFVPAKRTADMLDGVKLVSRLVLQSLVIGAGAYIAINGDIEIGFVIGISLVAGRALTPIDGVAQGWPQIIDGRAAVGRLSKFMAKSSERQPKMRLPRPKGQLEVENLSFAPEGTDRHILKSVSFEVKPGEALAVIGVTTSGKSTLLRLIAGGLRPSSGVIRLDGNELHNWTRNELELYTGYMPQDGEFLNGTVAQVISRFDHRQNPGLVVRAAKDAGIYKAILGYPQGFNTPIGPNGMPLAAGHRQFVALARAMYRRPPLLLLDEPNACLDAEGDRRLAAVLAGLKERKTTVVLVTQRPILLDHVDRVLVLKRGGVHLLGTPDEVRHGTPRLVKPARSG